MDGGVKISIIEIKGTVHQIFDYQNIKLCAESTFLLKYKCNYSWLGLWSIDQEH